MARRPERRLVSQVAPWFLAALKRSGGDLCELGARYQLPEDADRMPEFELPLRTLDALTAEIAERLARPHLGVEIIERLPRGSYGLLEFIVRSAANVRDATRGVARYQGLLNDLVTIRFEERDGAGFLSQRIAGVRECVGVQCNELFVALVVKMLRELVGRDWRPAHVWFAHPAPADSSALSEWFGPHLEFDHGLNQVEIPASDLDRAIPSSDPALLAIYW